MVTVMICHWTKLKNIQRHPKNLYTPTRRSKRKASINITVEEMTEVKQTLQRSIHQKELTLTLDRAIKDYIEKINKQHNLNLLPQAFFTVNSIADPTPGASLEYPQLKLGDKAENWIKGCSNETGRLARGVHPQIMIGSNTIHFIHPSQKPSDRVATYLRIDRKKKNPTESDLR